MTFYSPFGDIAECDKWLPWAKGRIANQVPPIMVYRPVENVEVMCNKIEDRIMITAGGLAVVTYLDQFSPDPPPVEEPVPLPPTPTGWEYWKRKVRRTYHINFGGLKRNNNTIFAEGERKEFMTDIQSDIRLEKFYWVSPDRKNTLHYSNYLRPDSNFGHDLMLNNVIYRTGIISPGSINVLAIAYSGKGLCRMITYEFVSGGSGALYHSVLLTHRTFILNAATKEADSLAAYTTYAGTNTQFAKHIYASFLGDGNTAIIWHQQWTMPGFGHNVSVHRKAYPNIDNIGDPDITTVIYDRAYAFGEASELGGTAGIIKQVLTYHDGIYFSMLYENPLNEYRCELYEIVGDSLALVGEDSVGIGDVLHLPPDPFKGMNRCLFANKAENIYVYAFLYRFAAGNPLFVYIRYKGEVLKAEDIPITVRVGEEAPIADTGNAKAFMQDAYDGVVYVLAYNSDTLIIGMKAKPDTTPNIIRFGYRVDRLETGPPSTGSLGSVSVALPK